MNKLQVIKGIECYEDENGIIQLKLENVCWGLGFTKSEKKNGKEYASIRWERVFNYLNQIEFDHKGAKDIFIPEPIFYMLAMKAESIKAIAFQKIVAYEILPQIRKTGSYIPNNASKELKAIFMLDEKQQILEDKVNNLENNMTIDHGQAVNIKHAVDIAVKRLCFGSETPAYKSKDLKRKIYQYAWRNFKDYFNITAYHNLLRKDMETALGYIQSLILQGSLLREVQSTNNQMSF
ncbi:ORF6C domain protein [Clostridium saccharobutylicum]|uniref:ORF6C domain-containing protein n=1 Tax=Clostridium saccharobutylicum TaxID=169679 RepID=UPI00098C04EF|nr:ORF6C domain-containing protein [Clostridium saccharobutylicum]OOM17158.1 ORF6C domain protein [Clostridium saccharobutylicum]